MNTLDNSKKISNTTHTMNSQNIIKVKGKSVITCTKTWVVASKLCGQHTVSRHILSSPKILRGAPHEEF